MGPGGVPQVPQRLKFGTRRNVSLQLAIGGRRVVGAQNFRETIWDLVVGARDLLFESCRCVCFSAAM